MAKTILFANIVRRKYNKNLKMQMKLARYVFFW